MAEDQQLHVALQGGTIPTMILTIHAITHSQFALEKPICSSLFLADVRQIMRIQVIGDSYQLYMPVVKPICQAKSYHACCKHVKRCLTRGKSNALLLFCSNSGIMAGQIW